jgi:DNA invertase Pin-like site-specific DNA recombinase
VETLIRPGIFAAFAEFERRLMLERQRAGIVKAKKEGKYRGKIEIQGRNRYGAGGV